MNKLLSTCSNFDSLNDRPDSRRSFVFLQMPQSRFGGLLRDRLTALGHQVHKINFCGGDVFHWAYPEGHSYRGTRDGWPLWFTSFMLNKRITDVVLTGDRRPMHQVAILLARLHGLRVYVFEEGYLRPSFITLEPNGVNARSEFPNCPKEIRKLAQSLPPLTPQPELDTDLRKRTRDTIKHHLGKIIMLPFFIHYRTHRPIGAAREMFGLVRRYLTRKERRLKDEKRLDDFLAGGREYCLFPLQISADTQIRRYSEFLSIKESVAAILTSFKRAAPPELSLVVRSHPLDSQIISNKRFTLNYARAIGLTDRVCYVDEGNTSKMIAGAKAVALVNSTTGLAALRQGKPVFCLGRSIYAIPGLAAFGDERALDKFWSSPEPPDMNLLDDFIRLLQERALVPGNFHTDEGIRMTLEGCLKRFGCSP